MGVFQNEVTLLDGVFDFLLDATTAYFLLDATTAYSAIHFMVRHSANYVYNTLFLLSIYCQNVFNLLFAGTRSFIN